MKLNIQIKCQVNIKAKKMVLGNTNVLEAQERPLDELDSGTEIVFILFSLQIQQPPLPPFSLSEEELANVFIDETELLREIP